MSPGSATGVLMRKIPAATSSTFVPDCVFVIMSGLVCGESAGGV
jgi:hypothetical protein